MKKNKKEEPQYTQSGIFEKKESSKFEELKTGESTSAPGYVPTDKNSPFYNQSQYTAVKRDYLDILSGRVSIAIGIWSTVIAIIVFLINTTFSINNFLSEVKSSLAIQQSSISSIVATIQNVNNRIDTLIDNIKFSNKVNSEK